MITIFKHEQILSLFNVHAYLTQIWGHLWWVKWTDSLVPFKKTRCSSSMHIPTPHCALLQNLAILDIFTKYFDDLFDLMYRCNYTYMVYFIFVTLNVCWVYDISFERTFFRKVLERLGLKQKDIKGKINSET